MLGLLLTSSLESDMQRALSIIGLLTLAGVGRAQVFLPPIDDPNFRQYPIAMPAFKDLGSGGGAVADEGYDILRFDLGLTGAFKLLDPRSFLANPTKEGITGSSINFGDWLNVGAEGLIKVGLAKVGTELTLDAYLFDVATGKEAVHAKLTGQVTELRQLVHQFADKVVRHLTGVRSVFATQIAFVKKMRPGVKSVCLMDFDGFNEHCVADNGSLNLLPAWDASGRGFYYSSYIKGGPFLYYFNLKTNKAKSISKRPGLNIGASASADGKFLALQLSQDDNSEIYLLNSDGSNAQRLTRNWAIDASPTFSPDSRQIAFVSERAGTPQIYVMDRNGDNPRRLTFAGNYNQTPNWSPRGDWILFCARDERLVFDIFKVNADSGEIRRLTQDTGNNEHPRFSPDGNLVVFSSTRSGESKIYVMNADGTNQHLISRNKGDYSTPAWSPWTEAEGQAAR